MQTPEERDLADAIAAAKGASEYLEEEAENDDGDSDSSDGSGGGNSDGDVDGDCDGDGDYEKDGDGDGEGERDGDEGGVEPEKFEDDADSEDEVRREKQITLANNSYSDSGAEGENFERVTLDVSEPLLNPSEMDDDSDIELWLLRVPRHTQLREALVNKEIEIGNDESSVVVKGNYQFRTHKLPEHAEELPRPAYVVPGDTPELKLGKKFARYVSVEFRAPVKQLDLSPPKRVYPNMPSGMKMQFPYMGTGAKRLPELMMDDVDMNSNREIADITPDYANKRQKTEGSPVRLESIERKEKVRKSYKIETNENSKHEPQLAKSSSKSKKSRTSDDRGKGKEKDKY